MTRICNPFLTVDMNFFDRSMIVSDKTIADLSITALSRFDPIGINTATSLINVAVRNIDTSRFPTIKARYEAFPFTPVEIAEFAYNSFYSEFEIIDIIENASVDSAPADTLFQNLEQFLDKNAGAAAANGFCSIIANPFKKLLNIINKINLLLNFSLADIFSMIKAQIEALKEKLLAMIDTLIQGILSKIQNIIKRIAEFKDALFSAGMKVAAFAKSVFSANSVETLKENVKTIIDRLVGQFPQPLTLEAGMTILFRMCQMIEKLQQLFQNPLKAVEDFVKKSQLYTTNLTNQSNATLAITNAYGVPLMNYSSRNSAIQQRLAQLNGGSSRPYTTPSASTNSVTTFGGTAGSTVYTGTSSKQVVEIQETGAGFNILKFNDGSVERREGARNWRNNNPGNLEFGNLAKKYGAIGTDGRFAIFPSFEAGQRAQEALLFETDSYKNLTIAQAINRYAPPVENNTSNYVGTVARDIGVSPDTPLSSLTADQRQTMLESMHKVEGFKPGTVDTLTQGNNAYQAQHPGYSFVNVTEEEKSWILQLNTQTAQSDPDLIFSNSILTMAKRSTAKYNGGGPKEYWIPEQNVYSEADFMDWGLEGAKINPNNPLIKLRRIAKKLGRRITINSAFRSDYYQRWLIDQTNAAAPGSSPHRTGGALDIAYPEGDSARAELAELLSREGFTRLGLYDSFMHADHNPVNGWLGPYFNSQGPMLKEAVRRHYAGVFKTDTAPITPSTGGSQA